MVKCDACGKDVLNYLEADGKNLCMGCYSDIDNVNEKSVKIDKKYKRVGGWLLLFCLSLVIFIPAISFFNIATGLQDSIDYNLFSLFPKFLILSIFDIIISIGLIIFAIIAGFELIMIRQNAVSIAKKFLIIYLLYGILINFGLYFVDLPFGSYSYINSQVGRNIFTSLIYFGIWYSYLSSSKRVKMTYQFQNVQDKYSTSTQQVSHHPQRYCPNCGRYIPFDAKICPYCGKKFSEFQHHTVKDQCPSCGFEIQSGDIFCGNCGKKVAGPDIGGPNVKELEPLKAPIMPEEESGYRFHYIEYSEKKDPFSVINLIIGGGTPYQINLKGIGELSASTIGFVGSPTISMYYKIDNGNPVSINLTPSGRCTALLDTTKLSDGEHILTVKAVDSQSRQATKSVKIIVKNKS